MMASMKRPPVLVTLACSWFPLRCQTPRTAAEGAAPSGQPAGQPAGRGRAAGPGYSQAVRLEHALRPARSGRHLVAERERIRRRWPLPRLRRSRLQLRVSRVHAGGPGRLRPEHSVVRPHEGQRRRQGASRRSTSDAAGRSRQRSATIPTARATRWACRAPILYPDPGRVHRAARPHLPALPVGLRPAHRVDGRPQAAEPRRHRPARGGGATPRRVGRATRWSSSPPATTSARGSTTSAIRTAIRWCCARSTRAPTSTRSNCA